MARIAICILALSGLSLILSGSTAAAGDYCEPAYVYKPVVCYKTVICYETRSEPYTVCVIKYDHCGYPYKAYETRYREIQVPVTKEVAYTKYVKVPAY